MGKLIKTIFDSPNAGMLYKKLSNFIFKSWISYILFWYIGYMSISKVI